MIYKLSFENRVEWCTAKNQLHLLKSYDLEFELELQELALIEEMTEEESKSVLVTNTEYDPKDAESFEDISIFDLAAGDDFEIIASSEF